MNIRKRICIFLSAALLLFPSCSAFSEAAKPDYYRIGLKVTAMMSEITDSEAYLSIFTRPEYFREVREKVNTHDYDSPVAVYSVTMSDPRAFFEEVLRDEEEGRVRHILLHPERIPGESGRHYRLRGRTLRGDRSGGNRGTDL